MPLPVQSFLDLSGKASLLVLTHILSMYYNVILPMPPLNHLYKTDKEAETMILY